MCSVFMNQQFTYYMLEQCITHWKDAMHSNLSQAKRGDVLWHAQKRAEKLHAVQ